MHYAYCVKCPSHWHSISYDRLEIKAAQHESGNDGHFVKVEYPVVRTEE